MNMDFAFFALGVCDDRILGIDFEDEPAPFYANRSFIESIGDYHNIGNYFQNWNEFLDHVKHSSRDPYTLSTNRIEKSPWTVNAFPVNNGSKYCCIFKQ